MPNYAREEVAMRAGYARIDITPTWPLELCGYGYYLGRVSNGVHDPLYARVLAMESDGQRALILNCDLVGLSEPMVSEIRGELSGLIGVDGGAIMIACTHTHSGPATFYLRGCGKVDPRYIEWVQPRLIQAACDAWSDMQTVDEALWSEAGPVGMAFNRTYGSEGPLDDNIRTLVLRRSVGRPIMVANYACHPVANGVNDMVSADYPGYALTAIEKLGFDGLFLTGFAGDVDPIGSRNYAAIERHGNQVAAKALESLHSAVPLNDLRVLSISRTVQLPYDIPGRSVLMGTLQNWRDRLEADPDDREALVNVSWVTDALQYADDPKFVRYSDAEVQAIALGNVAIVAFPGETFTAIGTELRRRHPGLRVMTVHSANASVGYIPTEDEFDRQGYGSHAAARIYRTFTFKRGFGELMTDEGSTLLETGFPSYGAPG